MTKVIRFHKTGGPEVLQIDQIDVAPPKDDEVQIQTKALGLNRAESMFRSGKYLDQPEFPSKLGYEAAGVVQSFGKDVKGLKVGDAVSVAPPPNQGKWGVYGELVNVPAYFVIKHPANLSFNEAAAAWMQYLTAYGALVEVANIYKGDYVVIPAASSSVGIAAIQICNLVGAKPIALTRTNEKKKALEEVGAAHVVVTQDEPIEKTLMKITNGKGVRVVFDPVGGPTILELSKAMSQYGIMILYGALSPEPTPLPLFDALFKSLTLRGYVLFEALSDPTKFDKAKKFIIDGLTTGKLKPVIDKKVFKFDQMVDAHKHLESNKQFGKIVVTV